MRYCVQTVGQVHLLHRLIRAAPNTRFLAIQQASREMFSKGFELGLCAWVCARASDETKMIDRYLPLAFV